jgi:hypothetical protein
VSAFQLQGQQRDEVAGNIVCRRLIGGAVDQQPRPQPTRTEGVQLAAPPVPDIGGRRVQALIAHGVEQFGQLCDESFTAGVRLGEHSAEQVDDDSGPARRLAMRGEDAEQTSRRHRGGGHGPLGPQRPLQLLAFGAGAVREHRLRHRDERHRIRDGEQWHPDVVGGGDQPGRRPLMGELGAESQSDGPHPGLVEFGHVGPAAGGGAGQQQADGQQQLAALQPWAGMGQFGDGRRLDLAVGAGVAGHQLQAEFCVRRQLGDREHGHIVEQLSDTFYKSAIPARIAFGKPDCHDEPDRTGR